MLAGGEEEDPAVGGELEVGGDGELPRTLAFLAELPEEPPIGGKDLEVHVAPIQDINIPLGVDLEVQRPVENGFRSSGLTAEGQIVLERVPDHPVLGKGGIEDGLDPVDGLDLDGVCGDRSGFIIFPASPRDEDQGQSGESGNGFVHGYLPLQEYDRLWTKR